MSFFVCKQTLHFLLLGLRYTVSITDDTLKRRYSKVTSIWEEIQVLRVEDTHVC
jgi:hypothetical protein